MKRKELYIICLLGFFFTSGCSVINFGIGAVLEGSRKTVLKEEFHPNYLPPVHAMRYSSKVFTASGVKEADRCDGFFIKEKRTDNLFHVYADDVTIYKKDGSSLNGVLKYFGKNEAGLFFRFGSKTVFFKEIEKIQFYWIDADAIRSEDRSYILSSRENLRQKTLHHSEIEVLYLGFDVYSQENPPLFVEVGEVEKLIYKRETSILPYALMGAGLAVDLIAVALILIL